MEKTYNKEAAKYIIKDYIKDWVEFRDDGLYIKDDYLDHDWTPQYVFQWSPACDLPEHDALTAPVLPIPFTANQLAAFFLTGAGSLVASYYGRFEDGPDEGMLQGMGVRANHPREALRAAFAAYRSAQEAVGPLHEALQGRAWELGHKYEEDNIEANRRENVMESGISDSEYRERRERARASVAQLLDESDEVNRRAADELKAWRRKMVHRLLYNNNTGGAAAALGEASTADASGGDVASRPQNATSRTPTKNSTKTRRDTLTPVIERAQKQCDNPQDAASVWAALLVLAEKKVAPLIGATEDGLQYLKNGTAASLNREALRKRLGRQPPITAAMLR